MSQLIQQLRTEHQVLVARLEEVRSSIDPVTKKLPLEKAVFTLTLVKKGLLAHLGKEDDKLYPVLERAAKDDPAVKALLTRFGEDMAKISTAALAFFDKYNSRGLLSASFSSDLEGLYKVLAVRIGAEESELYPAYESAVQKYGEADQIKMAATIAPRPTSSGSMMGLAWLIAAVVMVGLVMKFVA